MFNPEKTRRAGFTLVELVIVVMIVGIVAAVAAPRYAATISRYRVEAAAKRIEIDLKLARRQAKIASAGQSIQFDTVAHSYVLPGVPHIDHPNLDYRVELAKTPYDSSITLVNFGGDAELLFDGYGCPDSAGTVVVQSGEYQKTVVVDPDTGEAKVQ